jgi:hypothetical protein
MIEKEPKVRPSARDLLKIRNVDLVLKLEHRRKELMTIREKTALVRKRMTALKLKDEKLRIIEEKVWQNQNCPVNL